MATYKAQAALVILGNREQISQIEELVKDSFSNPEAINIVKTLKKIYINTEQEHERKGERCEKATPIY